MLLYQRIAQYIQQLIDSGSFGSLGKLPSERELLETFSSTRITVRDALLRLEAEGLIYRRQRKGWFVSPKRLQWNPATKVNFYALARAQGFEPDTQVIFKGLIAEEELNAPLLQPLVERQPVKLIRKRFLNGRPVLLEEIHFSSEDFPGLLEQELDGSITEVMSRDYKINLVSEESRIWVTALPDEYASQLETNNGAACLKIIRRRYGPNNKLIDVNVEYWLHSSIEMVVSSQ